MPKDHKTNPKNTKQKNSNKSYKTKTIILLVLVGLFLIYDLSGVGGNIRFYAKWVACGQKPVRQGIMMAGFTPYYEESPTFSILRLSTPLFCSPIDAEQAGYSANSEKYEFPHLKDTGE